MLREVVNIIESNTGSMDRKTLSEVLNKHFERMKTIDILEGKVWRRKRASNGEGEDGTEGVG